MSECIGRDSMLVSAERFVDVLAAYVMKVYAPEHFAKLCGRLGLKQGCSIDLTNGFDFDTAVGSARAWAIIQRDHPLLVIGSPPCTYFSMLNELNKHLHRGDPAWLQRFDQNLEKFERHVRFCCSIYEHRLRQGRYFLHEHPWLARPSGGWNAYGRLKHDRVL